MGATTPNYALRYPSATDPADGPAGIGNLATDVDNVLKTQIWTPLNSRVAALEAIGPPPPDFTTNSGEIILQNPVILASGIWTPVLQTPVLAVGRWLILAQAQGQATDYANPGHTTIHVVGLTTVTLKTAAGSPTEPTGGQLALAVHMVAQVPVAQAFKLEAYNNQGKTNIIPTPPPVAEGNVATRLAYIRLA